MKKYFYLVDFQYLTHEKHESFFDLGVFSTKKKAEIKISQSITLPGFNKYGKDYFSITKFGVDFDSNIQNKSNVILYCVFHEYENEVDGFTYWNIFDYFSTKEKANDKIKYLKKHSKIGKQYPDNFDVIDIQVDSYNSWLEGFDELTE